MKSNKNGFYHQNKKKIWILSIIMVLVIVRLILPYVLLNVINKRLAHMKGYHGHIQDLSLSIYRGAYQVKNFYLNKADTVTMKETPFITINEADLSVEWKSLFHKRFVGELYVNQPEVLFTLNKVEPKDIQKDTTTLKSLFKDMMPLQVNRFEITQGKLRYKDPSSKPPVDIAMKDIYILAENFSSVVDPNNLLPGSVYADAGLYEGKLTLNMKVNPLMDQPTFDLNAQLQNTNLPLLNEFFKAYGKFDVNRGKFGLYTEFAAKDGKFDGYVKPLITDLKVLGPEDRKDSFLQKIWEGAVGLVGDVFKNYKKDQIATKVPIKGEFKNPTISTWTAIIEVLRNAFIQALYPAVDGQISIASVDAKPVEKKKSFLQKIFTKKDKKSK